MSTIGAILASMDRCDAAIIAWSRLQVVYGHLAGQINRALYRETGLSDADAAVLIALLETPNESLHSFELRCGLAWEKSRLSHQLRRMEARGLIERTTCPEDNRSSLIRMTPEGFELAERARTVLGRAIRTSLEGALDGDQLAELETMLAAVVAHLDSHAEPLS
ncbi:MAG: MarR family transcriptional regulator [Thermomicrobiales bacterium]|nr:MarR family transcriptional regulator [Thermomicrobiales bacterium]MCO5220723.1 MarR family transcriptional regulator [Thermomicrobiales bacterium]